jgi:RNA recognition motif-containing protein
MRPPNWAAFFGAAADFAALLRFSSSLVPGDHHWERVFPAVISGSSKECLMARKLYVGGLPYSVDSVRLEAMFKPHGTVQSAQVISDRDTGRSKGFGFVEMGSDGEAAAAIAPLNGSDCEGRSLTVNEAKPREPRSGGGGGGRRW